MTDDLRQAVSVSSPPSGGSSLDLTFQKVNPTVDWLPAPIPNPATSWNPADPTKLVEVHYYLNQDQLLRDVTALPSGSPDSWTLAQGVAGMQLQDRGDGIEIQLTLQESHRSLVLTGWCSRVSF